MTVAEGRVYCSGQVAQDPETGRIAFPDCYRQAQVVLENSLRMLTQAGFAPQQITKMTVLLTDIRDREAFERAFRQIWLRDVGPEGSEASADNPAGSVGETGRAGTACTCIGVLALPHPDAVVEVEMEGVAALNTPEPDRPL